MLRSGDMFWLRAVWKMIIEKAEAMLYSSSVTSTKFLKNESSVHYLNTPWSHKWVPIVTFAVTKVQLMYTYCEQSLSNCITC